MVLLQQQRLANPPGGGGDPRNEGIHKVSQKEEPRGDKPATTLHNEEVKEKNDDGQTLESDVLGLGEGKGNKQVQSKT